MTRYISLSRIGGFAALIAGISHLFLQSQQHLNILPHASFFLVFGTAQIWWAYQFLEYQPKNKMFYLLGTIINGGFLFTWFITRYFPAPFIGSPESITDIGILVAICETLALLGIFKTQQSNPTSLREIRNLLGLLFFISLATASSIYAGGMLGSNIFPELTGSHGAHGHHHNHSHSH